MAEYWEKPAFMGENVSLVAARALLRKRTMTLVRTLLLVALALVGSAGFRELGDSAGRAIAAHNLAQISHASRVGSKHVAFGSGWVRRLRNRIIRPSHSRFADLSPDTSSRWGTRRHAFGDSDNPIQLSWELEGDRPEQIINFYRPVSVPEANWLAMTDSERLRFLSTMGDAPWRDWERLSTAPDYLRKMLAHEDSGQVWETTSHTYVETLDELFEQAINTQHATGGVGFHFHTTFEPDPAFAAEIATYLAHVDELHTIEMYRSSAKNVQHLQLGPQTAKNIDDVRSSLARGKRTTHKTYSVGFRSHKYEPKSRVGYEFRATSGADNEQDRAFLQRTIEFLESPRATELQLLKDTRPYRIEDLMDLDRLEPATLGRFDDPTVVRQLYQVASARSTLVSVEKLVQRWAFPMLEWEQRPYLTHLETQIDTARQRYVRKVESVVRRWQRASPKSQRDAKWPQKIDRAVRRFVIDSGIATSY